MKKNHHDINDDEIRIISSKNVHPGKIKSKNKILLLLSLFIVLLIFITLLILFFSDSSVSEIEKTDELDLRKEEIAANQPSISDPLPNDSIDFKPKFVEITDTVINNEILTIFTPINAVPGLHIGSDILQDSMAVFVVQAADIRKDNGEILGAYVSEGNLLSRGQSKAGFCAIINGKLSIGVADATPYLEQAIENGGYFFRQYPLVVGGQLVENKLKPSSLRKALAELNGEIVVIMTHKKMTLNEFSQILVDLGVSNAIYLVGSSAYGFAIDNDGDRIEFGKKQENPSINTNYIVWQ